MDKLERVSRLAVIVVGAIALAAALDIGETIFAPIALALVAGVVLSPISDFWERLGFAPAVGALVSLALTLLVLAGLTLAFQPIFAQLVEQAPKVWSDMQDTIEVLRGLAGGLSDVTDEVSDAIAPDANAAEEAAPAGDAGALPSVTLVDALLLAPTIAAQVLTFAGALFFFLLTRSEIYAWAARRLAEPAERAPTAHRLLAAERQVSRYFLTITLINAGLGAATAVALQLLGMPGAILWGTVAFLLNFILYLGPAIVAVSLLVAGIGIFDGPYAVLPAAAFAVLNTTEGQFVTPSLVGRNMSMNPLVVFLSLVFGLWLWGPIGGIVAIPLLLWILVLNDGLAAATRPLPAAAE